MKPLEEFGQGDFEVDHDQSLGVELKVLTPCTFESLRLQT